MPGTHSSDGPRPLVVIAAWVCGVLVVVAASWQWQYSSVRAVLQECDARLAATRAMHQSAIDQLRDQERQRIDADETAFTRKLQDHDLLSGKMARQAREEEWKRRQQHEPGLATTRLETDLLQMEQLGRNPEVAAQKALEQVAKMAAPPRSRIEVVPLGEGQHVRVAFALSSLRQKESGGRTSYNGLAEMRREVAHLSAQLVRDLFDYCGTRGIKQISVSCNRAVRRSYTLPGATRAEQLQLENEARLEMICIYRVSLTDAAARHFASWREVSPTQLLPLLEVQKDGINDIKIQSSGFNRDNDSVDPNAPLRFE